MMITTWTLATALGQSAGMPGYVPPNVQADPFRPVTDGGPMMATETTRTPTAASAHSSWARSPLRFSEDDGEVVNVLDHAVALHVAARFGWGPLQIGAAAPAYLWTPGLATLGGEYAGGTLGDAAVDLKVAHRTDRWGVGGLAQATLSLGGQRRQLGHPGPTGSIGVVGDLTFDPVTVVGNLGFRGVPRTELGDVAVDDQLWWRAGVAVAVHGPWQVALEGFGHTSLVDADPSKTPAELMLGVHGRWLQAGFGYGVAPGVGTPAWRLVVGARWVSPRWRCPMDEPEGE